MNADPKTIVSYLHVNCARSFAIYKTIYKYKDEPILRENYWRMIANASQETAVIQWCSLFGSKSKRNKTHWLNSGVSGIKNRKEFQEKVLSKIPIPFAEWVQLHNSILVFRNKNVAHIDLDDWFRNIPYFDKAIQVLFLSFDILFEGSESSKLDLRGEYEKTATEANAIILKHINH